MEISTRWSHRTSKDKAGQPGQLEVAADQTRERQDDLSALRLLVVAEFASRDEWGDARARETGRVFVDKDNFGQVMGQLAGQVLLAVPNALNPKNRDLFVTIPLESIKSFHPDSLVEAVPPLRDLLKIRRAVVELREGQRSWEAFEAVLAEIPAGAGILEHIRASKSDRPTPLPPRDVAAPTVSGHERDAALDSLLEMVETSAGISDRSGAGGPGRSSAEALLDDFIALMGRGKQGADRIDAATANRVVGDLDAVLGAQVNAVLHHPEFVRLESVWRGLKLLVDRTDFREPIRIEVLNATKNTLAGAIKRNVVEADAEGADHAPIAVIVAPFEFSRSTPDMETLAAVGEQAEAAQAPLIASVGTDFLGLDALGNLKGLPYLPTYLDQPEYAKWKAFRQADASRWVALAFNRFLLRNRYGAEHERVRSFSFEESTPAGRDRFRVWANPVWGVATLLTASFVRTGFCADVTGPRGGGVIDNLPVEDEERAGGPIPLEVALSADRQQDFSDSGLIALASRPGSDAAIVAAAPVVHRPGQPSDPDQAAIEAAMSTLPYQMVATRIASVMARVASEILPGVSPESISRRCVDAVNVLCGKLGRVPGDAIDVRVEDDTRRPDRYTVGFQLQPARCGLAGLPPIQLGFSVRK
jgi:type VI secretion system protein ImpC